MKKIKLLSLTLLFLFGIINFAGAGTIDLRKWHQEGAENAGDWSVALDGSSVYQSINGNPTFYVSDTDYINTEFNGNFKVQNKQDNDFIGFVFGFNGLDDYYLFDWKKGEQVLNEKIGYEGFTLSKISGTTSIGMWDHQGTDITVLDSKYGKDEGWEYGKAYAFSLLYQDNYIKIDVDGRTVFEVAGAFTSGKFGFYNFSQEKVEYQGFEYISAPSSNAPVPEPATFLLFGIGLIGLAKIRRRFQ